MKTKMNTTAGYSLVETLVAIAVLLLAIAGPMTIAAQGIKSASNSLEQNAAFFLAQEGIETVYALRDDAALGEVFGGGSSTDWIDVLNSGPCAGDSELVGVGDSCSFGVDLRSNDGSISFTTDDCAAVSCRLHFDESALPGAFTHEYSNTESLYSRVITVEVASADQFAVSVDVSWSSRVFSGIEQTVSLQTSIFNLLP